MLALALITRAATAPRADALADYRAVQDLCTDRPGLGYFWGRAQVDAALALARHDDPAGARTWAQSVLERFGDPVRATTDRQRAALTAANLGAAGLVPRTSAVRNPEIRWVPDAIERTALAPALQLAAYGVSGPAGDPQADRALLAAESAQTIEDVVTSLQVVANRLWDLRRLKDAVVLYDESIARGATAREVEDAVRSSIGRRCMILRQMGGEADEVPDEELLGSGHGMQVARAAARRLGWDVSAPELWRALDHMDDAPTEQARADAAAALVHIDAARLFDRPSQLSTWVRRRLAN